MSDADDERASKPHLTLEWQPTLDEFIWIELNLQNYHPFSARKDWKYSKCWTQFICLMWRCHKKESFFVWFLSSLRFHRLSANTLDCIDLGVLKLLFEPRFYSQRSNDVFQTKKSKENAKSVYSSSWLDIRNDLPHKQLFYQTECCNLKKRYTFR